MKKFVIGLLTGIIIASAASVSAETVSVIGKKIDAVVKVTVNGNPLPVDAIAVSGKSYVPLADVGKATGYDVKYSKTEGITLTNKAQKPEVPVYTPIPEPTPTINKAATIQREIDRWIVELSAFKGEVERNRSPEAKALAESKVIELTKLIKELEAEKAALE